MCVCVYFVKDLCARKPLIYKRILYKTHKYTNIFYKFRLYISILYTILYKGKCDRKKI